MPTVVPVHTNRVFDLWLALLAGDAVWHAGDDAPEPRERAVATFRLVTLGVVVLVQWVAFAGRVSLFADGGLIDRDRSLALLAVAGTAAACALAVPSLRLTLGLRTGRVSFAWSLLWRSVALLTLIAASAALLQRARFLSAIPLGLVGGADAVLTMWVLGVQPQPRRWLQRFFFSSIHFGVIGAMLATAARSSDSSTIRNVLGLYVAMWTGVVVAGITMIGIDRLSGLVDRQRVADQAEIAATERSLRAHWLHDDVLSEIKLATLRIDAPGNSYEKTRRELGDLDHRLRLRQLDELVRGGSPHLYEILQPHLRRAQSLGIIIDHVPALEETDRRVDETTGMLVNRVIANLTANAINAGATHLSVQLSETTTPPCLEISIRDNAGGFDLEATPEGRGLAMLRRDLGSGGLERQPINGGSIMIARVPLPSDHSETSKQHRQENGRRHRHDSNLAD